MRKNGGIFLMQNDMSDMINQFKNILNNNSNNSDTSNTSSKSNDGNLNITPEMITNLAKKLQNSSLGNMSNESSSQETSSNDSNFSQATDTSSNLDIDTILKLKTIIETFNKKDDSRANLLYSLKPYLRESRQKKIDQYVNIFKLTAITNLFKKGKGDLN